MKKFIDKFIGYSAAFILFYYESYVQLDWTGITKGGRIYWAVPAFFRAVILWLVCPIALPEFFFKMSKSYQEFLKVLEQQKKKNAHMFT